ncbi:MAG: ABC transporter substrate-binding protein [Deltaproteobacteria bacterium]|nr:ABC transporter substrate-binding protein [Deltaproteobacteria bacterium]
MRVAKLVVFVMVLALVLGLSGPATAEKVKVGYLHTLAVDGQFWIAMEKGFFKDQGLEMEPIKFTSGIPLMQALTGGGVDVAIMGGGNFQFSRPGCRWMFFWSMTFNRCSDAFRTA